MASTFSPSLRIELIGDGDQSGIWGQTTNTNLGTLIEQAIHGDERAWHQLVGRYQSALYYYSLRLTGNPDDARDLLQDVLLVLCRNLSQFRGDSSFTTWLHSIATRTAIDIWRQEKYLRLTDSSEELELAEQTVACHSLQAPLEHAIVRLPHQARAVFVLFAIEGYGHKEIASMLAIAEGTSKAQYHRARLLLQEWLADE